jgi:hypothetical protein
VRQFRAGVMTITDPDVLREFIQARFGTFATPDAEPAASAAAGDLA